MKSQFISLFEQNKPKWVEYLRRQARHLCYKHGFVTADSLREFCGNSLPSWMDMRIIGGVLSSKDFQPIEFVKTERKTSHGRFIRKFKLRRRKK